MSGGISRVTDRQLGFSVSTMMKELRDRRNDRTCTGVTRGQFNCMLVWHGSSSKALMTRSMIARVLRMCRLQD
jgi:hypothetical protein